jgi:endonuclease/exonuclease/phosphatase family metal-dependent hydrolase
MKLAAAISSLLGLAALIGCAAHQPDPAAAPEQPGRLRVMTYNIHHGRGTDDKVDIERIAAVINAARPDLVAVQEVDVGVNRSGRIDEAAKLAVLTGMHVRFGKARDYGGGDYGQAILSERPITDFAVHELPGDARDEQRIALIATIQAGEGVPEMRFVATHLHHQAEAHRVAQAKKLLELLAEEKLPTVVAGDLNAEPGSRAMNLLLKRWRDTTPDDALTYPAGEPIKKIDWILLAGADGWTVTDSEVLDEPVASDHRPVVVELEIDR